MGAKAHYQKRTSGGRALRLEDGEVARIMYDAQAPDAIDSQEWHKTSPRKPCQGDGCPLCAAGVDKRRSDKLKCSRHIDAGTSKGEWVDCSLFLSFYDLERLAEVEPDEARRVVVDVVRMKPEGAQYSGLHFTLVKAEAAPGAASPMPEGAADPGDDIPF